TVFVAGGGNSAGQAAVHLARYAAEVTLLVRGAALASTMSQYLITQIAGHPRIAVRTDVEVVGGGGDGGPDHLVARAGPTSGRRASGGREPVAADALFVLIGAEPHTGWLPPAVVRDGWGFVVTGADLESPAASPYATSVPGVFAVGDVRHRSQKRVAAAVGEG